MWFLWSSSQCIFCERFVGVADKHFPKPCSIVSKGAINSFNEMFPLAVMHRVSAFYLFWFQEKGFEECKISSLNKTTKLFNFCFEIRRWHPFEQSKM